MSPKDNGDKRFYVNIASIVHCMLAKLTNMVVSVTNMDFIYILISLYGVFECYGFNLSDSKNGKYFPFSLNSYAI